MKEYFTKYWYTLVVALLIVFLMYFLYGCTLSSAHSGVQSGIEKRALTPYVHEDDGHMIICPHDIMDNVQMVE